MSAPRRILDVGCGAGRVLGALPDNRRAIGIDINGEAVRVASEGNPGHPVLNASMTALPFGDATFDEVWCLRFSFNALPTRNYRLYALHEFWRVCAHLDRTYWALEAFLHTVSQHVGRDNGADCHVELLTDDRPARAVLDPDRKCIRMHLPLVPTADLQVACIAVLQAAFRGLALLSDDSSLVLLHGSAVATQDARSGVAVIDGGTGAGKTSLSLALAERGCLLVNDEFLVCETRVGQLTAFCQPKLPWHIRVDMAPHLALSGYRPGFHAFPQRTAAADTVPIKVLVIPDWSLPVGTCAVEHGQLPDTCIADHLKKFANPCLDHVSLFASQGSAVTVTEDVCLHTLVEQRIAAMQRSLRCAALSLRLLRVGIGAPAEVGLAAETVMTYLERLP